MQIKKSSFLEIKFILVNALCLQTSNIYLRIIDITIIRTNSKMSVM